MGLVLDTSSRQSNVSVSFVDSTLYQSFGGATATSSLASATTSNIRNAGSAICGRFLRYLFIFILSTELLLIVVW